MANDLDIPPQVLVDPLAPFARVSLIGPHLLLARKLPLDWLQKEGNAVSILDVGLMDHYPEKQAGGINKDMSLPARKLLTTIIAVSSSSIGRFH